MNMGIHIKVVFPALVNTLNMVFQVPEVPKELNMMQIIGQKRTLDQDYWIFQEQKCLHGLTYGKCFSAHLYYLINKKNYYI